MTNHDTISKYAAKADAVEAAKASASPRFFAAPQCFESDVVEVARRAARLDWAFNNLLLDRRAHVFQLADLAGIFMETIGRDLRGMTDMAGRVREDHEARRNDAEWLEEEFDIALEWLVRARNLVQRYRGAASAEIEDSVLAAIGLEALEAPVEEGALQTLREEIIREARRRKPDRYEREAT